MVGPYFHSPALPPVCSYTPAPIPKKTVSIPSMGKSGRQQKFLVNRDIPGAWWHLFQSPEINELIAMGIANSPNLAAAKAVLVQAQQAANAQIGSTLLPTLTSQFSGSRQRVSGISSNFAGIFNLFNASVNISYTLDIFGGLRRQAEAAIAQVDFEQFELEAAYLTLTSNIVTTAFTIAYLRDQIKSTQELIAAEAQQLTIINNQFRLGGVSQASVLTQQTFLEQTRALLPPLQQRLAENMHALSVLIGSYPSDNCLPKFDLKNFNLPTKLPISCPSWLVRQRPDIQAAEALLHVASANVGVATANLFPQINLTGSYGFQSLTLGQLFHSNSKIWSYGASITEPIFNGGALVAQRRAAIAAYEQAAANYQQTVLQGFQQVADTLRALQNDAERLQAVRAAEIAASKSLKLVKEQYLLGGATFLSLLIAQQQYQQARISLVQAQAQRYIDTAALFQALGGGWWNRPTLECNRALMENTAQYRPTCF